MNSTTRRRGAILLGILASTTAVYWGVLSNGFVWDDFLLFIDDASLRSGLNSWAVIFRPILDGTTYLRPLVLLTFVAEFSVWGVNSVAAHGVNLALHLLNVVLVYVLILSMLGEQKQSHIEWRAAAAALFFALHPCLIESTAWISGRFDLMVTACVLLGLVADTRIHEKWKKAFALAVCFSLALGSKELAIVFPPLLLCWRLARTDQREQPFLRGIGSILARDSPTVVALGLVFAGYILIRLQTFGMTFHFEPLFSKSSNQLAPHFLLIANTLIFYIGQTAAPFTKIAPFHPLDWGAVTGSSGVVFAGSAVLLLVVLGYALRRRANTAYLALAALIALMPVLQILPLTIAGNIGHDRFLTLPLAFVALTLSSCPAPMRTLARRSVRRLSMGLVGVVWVTLSVASITVTIPLWRDALSLWTWIYHKYPDFEPAQSSYIVSSLRAQRLDLAAPVFERLIATKTMVSRQNFYYGVYLTAMGDYDEAENYIRGGLAAYWKKEDGSVRDPMTSDNSDSERGILSYAYSSLVKIDILQGRYEEALKNNETARHYAPDSPYYVAQRGLLLQALGNTEDGARLYAEGLRMTVPERRPSVELEKERFWDNYCLSVGQGKPACEGRVSNEH